MGLVLDARAAALWISAYLIGGIPFGWLVARARGINIRQHGSGNIGATNISRVLGRRWGIAVFLFDSGKCFAVMRAARYCAGQFGYPDPSEPASWLLFGAGLLAILGSVAPIWLGFRGGKAVSAAVGTLMGCGMEMAIAGVLCFAVWAVTVKLSGYVSLGSIVAAVLQPPTLFLLFLWMKRPLDAMYPLLLLSLAIVSLILFRHRANMARLRAGTEQRIGRARDEAEEQPTT